MDLCNFLQQHKHELQAIALAGIVLGAGFMIWKEYVASLIALVGTCCVFLCKSDSNLADEGVGCEIMFDENETLSILSGETYDLDRDEVEELLAQSTSIPSSVRQRYPATIVVDGR